MKNITEIEQKIINAEKLLSEKEVGPLKSSESKDKKKFSAKLKLVQVEDEWKV